MQPCMLDLPQVSYVQFLVSVFCIMCTTADHKNAKQEANNMLLDTKKKLNDQLQGAESETRKLKVWCVWKVDCMPQSVLHM